MDKDELVQEWLDMAQYDLETAEVMLSGGRFLYVAFMCHQVLEKTIKAYWISKKPDEVPHIHNLTRLAISTGLHTQMTEEQWNFLDIMVPMNIEARYQSYKTMVAKGLNSENCAYILSETKKLQSWIRAKL